MNKTIKKNRIWQPSVISLYTEIHEDDNDLTAFILETKHDPKAQRLGNCSEAMSFVVDFNTTISQSKPRQCAFNANTNFLNAATNYDLFQNSNVRNALN